MNTIGLNGVNIPRIDWVGIPGTPTTDLEGHYLGMVAFQLVQVEPGRYRLRTFLPRLKTKAFEWTESFHATEKAAKNRADEIAYLVWRPIVAEIAGNPIMDVFEHVTRLEFPSGCCDTCASSPAGNLERWEHRRRTMCMVRRKRQDDNGLTWIIRDENGKLYTRDGWVEGPQPEGSIVHPKNDRFRWTFSDALEAVRGMACKL